MTIENPQIRQIWLSGEYNRTIQDRSNSTVRFCLVNNAGEVYYSGGGSCHGSINGLVNTQTHCVITSISHRALTPANRVYLDWVLNHSPFASMFIEKDPDQVYANGVVMSVDVPSSKWLGGAQLARQFSGEFSDCAEAAGQFHIENPDLPLRFIVPLFFSYAIWRSNGVFKFNAGQLNAIKIKGLKGYGSSHSPYPLITSFRVLALVSRELPEDYTPSTTLSNTSFRETHGRWGRFNNLYLTGLDQTTHSGLNWDTNIAEWFVDQLFATDPALRVNEVTDEVGDYKVLWAESVAKMEEERKKKSEKMGLLNQDPDDPINYLSAYGVRQIFNRINDFGV